MHDLEEESSKIQLSQLDNQDFTVSNRLGAYWDTLGWVHFGLGHLDEAERYLKAAWTVMQAAVVGDHLGQVYEKLGKRREAVRAYRFALHALGRNGDPQMRDRLQSSVTALWGKEASASAMQDAGAELSEERTFKLPQVHNWGGGYKSAEFVVALAKEPSAADAKFVSGAKGASSALSALKSSFPFPDDSHARVVRRGVLSCFEISKGCVFVFYPADVAGPPLVGLPTEQQ